MIKKITTTKKQSPIKVDAKKINVPEEAHQLPLTKPLTTKEPMYLTLTHKSQDLLHEYLNEFCKKQNFKLKDLEILDDELFDIKGYGLVALTNSNDLYIFDVHDIYYDIDNNIDKGLIIEYFDYNSNINEMYQNTICTITYSEYVKGKRFDPSKDINDWSVESKSLKTRIYDILRWFLIK